MTTLHGELNTKTSKGVFVTSFLFQSLLIGTVLLVGLFTMPQLQLQSLPPLVPLQLRPVQIVDTHIDRTRHEGHGTGPAAPSNEQPHGPRILRVFVAPHSIPTGTNNIAFNDDVPPGTEVVYTHAGGNGPNVAVGGTGNGFPFDLNPGLLPPPPVKAPPTRIVQGGDVQASKLVLKVNPTFPTLAKNARISGKVILDAVISADGTIQKLNVRSGHPLLVPAAVDAVKQWRYSPTLLNKVPVEVQTMIEVTFILNNQI
jgi:TonB family protein